MIVFSVGQGRFLLVKDSALCCSPAEVLLIAVLIVMSTAGVFAVSSLCACCGFPGWL